MLTKIFAPDLIKELKRLNTTLEKLVEVWQDSNVLASKYTGHKVSYKEQKMGG